MRYDESDRAGTLTLSGVVRVPMKLPSTVVFRLTSLTLKPTEEGFLTPMSAVKLTALFSIPLILKAPASVISMLYKPRQELKKVARVNKKTAGRGLFSIFSTF
jgi:hypothetical protein